MERGYWDFYPKWSYNLAYFTYKTENVHPRNCIFSLFWIHILLNFTINLEWTNLVFFTRIKPQLLKQFFCPISLPSSTFILPNPFCIWKCHPKILGGRGGGGEHKNQPGWKKNKISWEVSSIIHFDNVPDNYIPPLDFQPSTISVHCRTHREKFQHKLYPSECLEMLFTDSRAVKKLWIRHKKET